MKTQTHILNQHTSKPIILDIELANEEDAPLIIFAHGFKGFKDWGHFNLLSKAFSEKGFHFLKFNFSCNGGTIENPIDFPDLEAFGNNTFSQEQEDLQIVINWAFDYLQPSSVILMGHSRGGGATIIKAANDKRISKLITLASVASFDRWTKAVYEHWQREGVIYIPNARTNQQMPLYWSLAEDYFKNEKKLSIEQAAKSLFIPTLIIHGEADEAVPYQEALQLKDWIQNSELLSIEEGTHTFGGKHPWPSKELPKPIVSIVSHALNFLCKPKI